MKLDRLLLIPTTSQGIPLIMLLLLLLHPVIIRHRLHETTPVATYCVPPVYSSAAVATIKMWTVVKFVAVSVFTKCAAVDNERIEKKEYTIMMVNSSLSLCE